MRLGGQCDSIDCHRSHGTLANQRPALLMHQAFPRPLGGPSLDQGPRPF